MRKGGMTRGGRQKTHDHVAVRAKLAARIRQLMEEQGILKKGLAVDAKCGKGTVTRVLRGSNTSVNVLVDIATALDCDIHDLFIPDYQYIATDNSSDES